jgi:hypothetical protein
VEEASAGGRGPRRRSGAIANADPPPATTEDIVHGVFFLMDNRAANGIDLELDGGILLV